MKRPSLSRFGLPLLMKELTEQAARRRTYVVRVVYAGLLFATAWYSFRNFMPSGATGFYVGRLGVGEVLLRATVTLQFVGIYLLLPAMVCGVLTNEKEHNTLGLLFLTRLGPWTILFEKLLGRLVPMWMFLLLSLPLMGYAYSLGGVSPADLWAAVWFLFITTLQVSALAIFCSAYFRTTVGAFFATYLLGGALYFALPLSMEIQTRSYSGVLSSILFGPRLIFELVFDNPQASSVSDITKSGILILASSLGFLWLARRVLVRRAFVEPRQRLMRFFRWLDRLFVRLNDRYARGIQVVHESASLPDTDPIAWRETTKRPLGTFRYLLRIFIVIEFPLLAVMLFSVGNDVYSELVTVTHVVLWCLAVLFVSVKSASLIAVERSHQTFDVLATLPLSSRDIMAQKLRGARRLLLVLSVPLLTVIAFEVWWRGLEWNSRRNLTFYTVTAVLAVVVYLPLASWLSFWVGLQSRTLSRAIIGSLAVIVGWCVVPVVIAYPLSPTSWEFSACISPAMIVMLNESDDFTRIRLFGQQPEAWLMMMINFSFNGFFLLLLRSLCLNRADEYLKRNSFRSSARIGGPSREPAATGYLWGSLHNRRGEVE